MTGRNCFGQPMPGPGQRSVDDVKATIAAHSEDWFLYSVGDANFANFTVMPDGRAVSWQS